MNNSSSFLRDTQHISTHDRRLVPGSTALQDRLQSSERCTRFCGPPAQRSHRHKRLKVSAQTVATVPQSQLPQSLRNNLVRLQADGPSGTCNVHLLGVSHVSQVQNLQLYTFKLSHCSLHTVQDLRPPENNSTKQLVPFLVPGSVQRMTMVGQCWLLMHFIQSSCLHPSMAASIEYYRLYSQEILILYHLQAQQ